MTTATSSSLAVGLVVGAGDGPAEGVPVAVGSPPIATSSGVGLGIATVDGVGRSVNLGVSRGTGLSVGLGVERGSGFGVGFGVAFGVGFGVGLGVGSGAGVGVIVIVPAASWSAKRSRLSAETVTG
jgi:hypothetical protein